jgi:hypothetical protein
MEDESIDFFGVGKANKNAVIREKITSLFENSWGQGNISVESKLI